MNPTLKAGDGLIVIPFTERPVKRGDVVVFRSPLDDKQVVHRVIHVSPQGIKTRGDNNRLDDPYLLQPADIIGRVVEIHRGRCRFKARNGTAGQYRAELRRTRNRFLFRLAAFLAKFAPKRIPLIRATQLNIATFKRAGREEQVLLLGRRAIGRRNHPEAPWLIRAPYRFFIGGKTLKK